MAKNSVADWDSSRANNTDVGGIDINEGCPAANINDGIREVMAQVKTYSGTIPALSSANTFTKIQKWAKGADVASASTLTLGDDGNYFDITGTTAITAIATKGVGTVVKLHFDASLTLTHHATDLILPGGGNIVTAAGDEAEFVEYATGDWRCTNYTRASENWVDVASATTTDIGAAASQNVRVTGTTTITGLGTVASGTFRRVRFSGILTLTHNGTSLILPGATNITTAAGDVAEFISEGSGNWRCIDYLPATYPPVVALGTGQTWQDVSGSRTHSTSYQNTTGRPIAVAIVAGATSRNIEVSANNSTWIVVGAISGAATVGNSFVVPIGWYYRINGSTTVVNWSELR